MSANAERSTRGSVHKPRHESAPGKPPFCVCLEFSEVLHAFKFPGAALYGDHVRERNTTPPARLSYVCPGNVESYFGSFPLKLQQFPRACSPAQIASQFDYGSTTRAVPCSSPWHARRTPHPANSKGHAVSVRPSTSLEGGLWAWGFDIRDSSNMNRDPACWGTRTCLQASKVQASRDVKR